MTDEELPVSDLLAARRIGEPAPDFWSDLEGQLADEPAPTSHDRSNVPRVGETVAEIEAGDGTVADLERHRRTRRRVLAIAATAAAAIAVVIGLSTIGDNDPPTITDTPTTTTTTGATIEDSMRSIEVGESAYAVESGVEATWVRSSASLMRIDPRTDEIVARIEMPLEDGTRLFPGVLGVSETDVWAIGGHAILHRVDLATNSLVATIDMSPTLESDLNRGLAGVTIGDDAVWVSTYCIFGIEAACRGGQLLIRIDPSSGSVVETVEIPSASVLAVVGDETVWVVGDDLYRVDPATARIAVTIDLPPALTSRGLVVDDDVVWVIDEHSVHKIDPATDTVTAEIDLYDQPWNDQTSRGEGVAVDGDLLVWVPRGETRNLFRVDSVTNEVVGVDLDIGQPSSLAANAETIWVVGPGQSEVSRIPLDALPTSHP